MWAARGIRRSPASTTANTLPCRRTGDTGMLPSTGGTVLASLPLHWKRSRPPALPRRVRRACSQKIHISEYVLSFDLLPGRARSTSVQASRGLDVRDRHRQDAPGADRRSNTHTVASVRITANEASAMRLAPVPPWKVSR
jgi:hypothetical protein